jgi:prevent-host-death family protein
MKKHYDFSKGKRNPYAGRLKKQITIRLDEDTLEYFKQLAAEAEIDTWPITYLKSNTADLVREVSEKRRPVTITQNGVAKVVVMDVETYDRWRAAMALLEALAQGEADLERGRTVKQAAALRRARRAIERAAGDG